MAELNRSLPRGAPIPGDAMEDFVSEALKALPQAKADLIAAGYPEDEVENMVPGQAVLLDIFEIYEVHRDDLVKWRGVPHWQAWEGMQDAKSRIGTSSDSLVLTWLARWLVPVLDVSYAGEAWHERGLAALQCVEAIKLYMATHKRELPPSLDAIRAVPIPINPMTNGPFGYRLEGDTAIIDADGGPDFLEPQEYRVRVAK